MKPTFVPIKTLETMTLEKIYEGPPTHVGNILEHLLNPDETLRTGFIWTEINNPVIHTDISQTSIKLSQANDAIYDIHYRTPWSEMIKKPSYVINGEIEDYLSDALSELWNIDAGPLSRIITSYCASNVWTHYLDWAYSWIKRGREIEIMDLILEMAFGFNILKQLKLPPIEALEQDDWKLLPVVVANDSYIDSRNFTKEEPLLLYAARWTFLIIERLMIKRFASGQFSVGLVPDIFYSSSLITSNLWLELNKRKTLPYLNWKYSSADSVTILDGLLYRNTILSDEAYNPLFDEFDYCQLCKNETIPCSRCKFRDLLFCPKHSAMINQERNGSFCDNCLKAT